MFVEDDDLSLFVECLPSEDCPEITDLIYSEPGVESTIDTSGCCPQLKEVCKIEKCPPPPNCPDFWELRKRDVEQCCLQYKCGKQCIIKQCIMGSL